MCIEETQNFAATWIKGSWSFTCKLLPLFLFYFYFFIPIKEKDNKDYTIVGALVANLAVLHTVPRIALGTKRALQHKPYYCKLNMSKIIVFSCQLGMHFKLQT